MFHNRCQGYLLCLKSNDLFLLFCFLCQSTDFLITLFYFSFKIFHLVSSLIFAVNVITSSLDVGILILTLLIFAYFSLPQVKGVVCLSIFVHAAYNIC